jgi:hypothetical protein
MGGEGVEFAQDVAIAPDGTIVVLNAIGVRGNALQQVGFVRRGADGGQLAARAIDVGGAALRFPAPGALAIAPSGDLVVAFNCAGACPRLAGAAAAGAVVASFSAAGDLLWVKSAPGAIASNPAVGPDGDVAVAATGSGGPVVRRFAASGAQRWERAAPGVADGAPLAVDGDGGVVYARGDTVVKVDAAGAPLWERSVGAGAGLAGLRANASGIVAEGPSGDGTAVTALGSDGAPRWSAAVAGAGRTLLALDAEGRSVLVTGADGCGATVTALDAAGAQLWSRALAQGGCRGNALVVRGAAATRSKAVVAGSLSSSVDLGTGALDVQATDGFVAELSP